MPIALVCEICGGALFVPKTCFYISFQIYTAVGILNINLVGMAVLFIFFCQDLSSTASDILHPLKWVNLKITRHHSFYIGEFDL
jgi:hypothetical protein